MKIKLMLYMVLGLFAIAATPQEANGQMIEMAPYDHSNIPSIYVGNLPQVWDIQALHNHEVFANDKKNVFVISDSNESTLNIKMRPNLKKILSQHQKSKAFLANGKWNIVDEHGKIIKKIKK